MLCHGMCEKTRLHFFRRVELISELLEALQANGGTRIHDDCAVDLKSRHGFVGIYGQNFTLENDEETK